MKRIIFDFDGTLTPYPITEFKILEKCGYVGGGNNKELHKIVKDYKVNNNKSVYEAFYEVFLEVLKKYGYELNDETLSYGANEILYNKGIEEFFEYLSNKDVENYIVSSSMKPFLKKVAISKYFKEIYASTFNYENNRIIGHKDLMSDIKKVDAIKEIVKDSDYANVIYIGDGLTDLKAMEYIKLNGGTAIYVTDNLESVLEEDKKYISYIFNKDYSLNGELFNTVKRILNL